MSVWFVADRVKHNKYPGTAMLGCSRDGMKPGGVLLRGPCTHRGAPCSPTSPPQAQRGPLLPELGHCHLLPLSLGLNAAEIVLVQPLN